MQMNIYLAYRDINSYNKYNVFKRKGMLYNVCLMIYFDSPECFSLYIFEEAQYTQNKTFIFNTLSFYFSGDVKYFT